MQDSTLITLAHGDGGRETRDLIEQVFLPVFSNSELAKLGDAAVLPTLKGPLAVTTDSFVINPLFFPGGDIGKLAIAGTVNDLAVSGATPAHITAAFILEEGLRVGDLRKIAISMAAEAAAAGVSIVAADTKVVEKGHGDGVFINTTGIGFLEFGSLVNCERIEPGDLILINGDIGLHGSAVLNSRQDMELTADIRSDCACLNGLIRDVLVHYGESVRYMRDPTRGGVAITLIEIARAAGLDLLLEERKLPFSEETRGYCDFLGLDPLYLANEGKVLLIIDRQSQERVLTTLQQHPLGRKSYVIGQVAWQSLSPAGGRVFLKTLYGGTRELSDISATQFPRIC